MQITALSLLWITAFATSTAGHVVMGEPKPFTRTGKHSIDQDSFPCQGLTEGPENSYGIGDNITINFLGQKPATAVHGGGSCQFSLTADSPPSKSSKFKAFATIQGGCPAYTEGNIPGGRDDPFEFIFQIPPDIPSGKYTFAWTWFSRISGELYMNCAAVNVHGSQSQQKFGDLPYPDMLVANIGKGCKTPKGKNAQMPSPGNNVLLNDDPANAALPEGCGNKRDHHNIDRRDVPAVAGKPNIPLRIAVIDNQLPAYSGATQVGDPGPAFAAAT